MAVWPTNLERWCTHCGNAAKYINVPDEGEVRDTRFLCAKCAGDEPEPQRFTLTTEYNDEAVDIMACTFVDDGESYYCGEDAEVFVLVDGSWEYDCLCSEHMGVSWMPYNLHHHSTYKKPKRLLKPSPQEIEALRVKLDEYERLAGKSTQEYPPPSDPARW